MITAAKKKKKKKSAVTVCTTGCKFDVVRRVAAVFGIEQVGEDDPWNLHWSDSSVSVARAKLMKRFQRVNHFPGMIEICRKDFLAKNLNRMHKRFPGDYDFFPRTWCLPPDFGDLSQWSKLNRNKVFIMKPDSGSRGRGIYLTKNLDDIEKTDKYVCQVYVSKPYLIDGYKFDMRVYTLVSSCDPLRIYVYNEGLVRFATAKYADPNCLNCDNVFMHLTNYSVNKRNPTFSDHGKRKISDVNAVLESKGVDVGGLWRDVDRSIVKTIISAWPVLKHNYNACFSSHENTRACFEILGFDVLLDRDAKPFILEVNLSPSLHTDSRLDKEVKETLIADTFTLLDIWRCDKRKIIEEDKRRIERRLLYGTGRRGSDENAPDARTERDTRERHLREQVEWEENHMGNFRCAYPNGTEYDRFFRQPPGSLYYTTVSSRARLDCVKQQIEGIVVKQKVDMLRRFPSVGGKCAYSQETDKGKIKSKLLLPTIAKKKKTVYGAHEPMPIVESEERLRLSQRAYREALVENHGIRQKIYHMMKQMGTLTSEDENKYGHALESNSRPN